MATTGIFHRKTKDAPWARLKAVGNIRELYAFREMFPGEEIALFEYENIGSSMPFNKFTAERMKRVF